MHMYVCTHMRERYVCIHVHTCVVYVTCICVVYSVIHMYGCMYDVICVHMFIYGACAVHDEYR